jgi:HSP20 family protein
MAVIRWRPLGQSLERWDPGRDMVDLQQEVNRLFDSFFGRGPQMAGPPMTGQERAWAPVMDMYETKDELVITAELPGVNEKDVQLSITGDVLTLRGERASASETSQHAQYRSERWYGRFERSVALPIPVQADQVKASYRDGVLTVKLPKAEEIKPKQIKIDVL